MPLEIVKNFDDVLKIAKFMYEQQKSKADETVPKIMKIESCKYSEFGSHHLKFKSGYYSSDRDPQTVEEYERQLAAYLKKNEADIAALNAVHDANAEAIKNNVAIHNKVKLIMKEIGLPSSWSERDYKSKARITPKYVTVPAGYLDDLARNVPISDGYEYALSVLKRNPDKAKEYVNKHLVVLQQKEREAEKLKAKQKAEKVLVHMRIKYETEIEADVSDILDAILDKNKYLRLAHYMLMTRNDWSEGFGYAERGLDSFLIETDEDNKIFDAVQEAIDDVNGDRDGRVFRDMEYNYGYIFGLVNNESLMNDYNTIYELYEKERY